MVIGANSLMHQMSGVGRMTLEIVRATQEHPNCAELHLLIGERLKPAKPLLDNVQTSQTAALRHPLPMHRRVRPLIGRIPGVQFLRAARDQWRSNAERAEFALRCNARVVYHEPNMIATSYPAPTVVTFNDLSWHSHPDMHPAERIRWIERNLPRTLAQATRFVAISVFTANEMVRHLGINRDQIDVVPLAAGPEFLPISQSAAEAILQKHRLSDRSYVLSVSTLEPRKNFDRLLAAHRALPPALRRRFPLVIVGGAGWGRVLESGPARDSTADGTLVLLGWLPDTDLAALYARAAAVAYVSLYEGFGLPVLEAMAAGAPMIASATTAVGEIANGAALTVDPRDETAISDAMRQVLEDASVSDTLRADGLVRAANYSWQRTTDLLFVSWGRALLDSRPASSTSPSPQSCAVTL